jgi:hypothetical protein
VFQKAKMMWELGKRQVDKKNRQLKILRMKNFRLNKKIKTLENLVTHLKNQNRVSEECEIVLKVSVVCKRCTYCTLLSLRFCCSINYNNNQLITIRLSLADNK